MAKISLPSRRGPLKACSDAAYWKTRQSASALLSLLYSPISGARTSSGAWRIFRRSGCPPQGRLPGGGPSESSLRHPEQPARLSPAPVKIVLDTTILVRANEHSHGLARELLTNIVESKHTLLLSNEMLHELARKGSALSPIADVLRPARRRRLQLCQFRPPVRGT